MVFIAPVELEIALVVLVGSAVDAEAAVGVGFGLILFGKLVLCKRLCVVLMGIGCLRRGIQTDEGCVNRAGLCKF